VGDLRDAFDSTVTTSILIQPVDSALIEAGRKIADQIDLVADTGTGQEVTKALYLVPHMVNILKEMLATPASRKTAGIEKGNAGGKLASLSPIKRPKRTA